MKALKSILVILLLAFSINCFNNKFTTYLIRHQIIVLNNDTTKNVLQHKVVVTMYCATPNQCDSTPLITADGSKINPEFASNQKLIAVSRDLLKIFKYGDYVEIKGIGEKDGVYRVADCMAKRIKNTVDILETINTKPYKFKEALITLVCPL